MTGPRFPLPDGAREVYLAGATLEEVAAEFGSTYGTIRRRLLEAGVPIRQGKTPAHRAKIGAAHRISVPEFEPGGRSTLEIAESLGVSEETVRRRMKERGQARLPATARPGHGQWNGGRTVDKDGYLLVLAPRHPQANASGYVREHRLVMEASLGRLLAQAEVVDHRNGTVDDNRPENLDLYPSNAEHLRATLTGRRKQSTRQRRFPAGGAIPTASETGALPSLQRHPLWPFVLLEVGPPLSGSSPWQEPAAGHQA